MATEEATAAIVWNTAAARNPAENTVKNHRAIVTRTLNRGGTITITSTRGAAPTSQGANTQNLYQQKWINLTAGEPDPKALGDQGRTS